MSFIKIANQFKRYATYKNRSSSQNNDRRIVKFNTSMLCCQLRDTHHFNTYLITFREDGEFRSKI